MTLDPLNVTQHRNGTDGTDGTDSQGSSPCADCKERAKPISLDLDAKVEAVIDAIATANRIGRHNAHRLDRIVDLLLTALILGGAYFYWKARQ